MKDNKKKIIFVITIVAIIVLGIVYFLNKKTDVENIKYDIKITYKYSDINMPMGGYASNTEYVLVNIDKQKAYFVQKRIVFGDSTGKENGEYDNILNEEEISGNTFDMLIGLTERESDYNEKSFNNYYLVEYKNKKIKLTATPLLDSLFNSIKN